MHLGLDGVAVGGGVCITERSRAPISENCKVRGIGVAVMVRVSTLTFIWRSFSFTLTPNFCSSSIISSPKSLNLMLLPIILCVPIRILILPSPNSFTMRGTVFGTTSPTQIIHFTRKILQSFTESLKVLISQYGSRYKYRHLFVVRHSLKSSTHCYFRFSKTNIPSTPDGPSDVRFPYQPLHPELSSAGREYPHK